MTTKLRVLLILGATLLGFNALSTTLIGSPKWNCDPDSPTYFVCGHMVNLRSQIKLLGAQRELMQVNYDVLASVGQDMSQTVTRLEKMAAGVEHLAALETVRNNASNLAQLAMNKNPQALVAANAVQTSCMNCHALGSPSSGHSWDDIKGADWDYIVDRCKDTAVQHNPYACKSMYGLISSVEYFDTLEMSKGSNFEAIEINSREMVRIVDDLMNKKMLHGSPTSPANLYAVRLAGLEMIELASQKDPLVFEKAGQVSVSCQQCHFVR